MDRFSQSKALTLGSSRGMVTREVPETYRKDRMVLFRTSAREKAAILSVLSPLSM